NVSAARMKPVMDRLEPVAVDMRVVLGGADVGVAQKFLDRSQICATGQQVGGEAMTEGMRAYFGVQTGAADIFLNDGPNQLASQNAAAAANEDPGNIGRRSGQLGTQFIQIAL